MEQTPAGAKRPVTVGPCEVGVAGPEAAPARSGRRRRLASEASRTGFGALASPEADHSVGVKRRVDGHDDQVVRLRLRDQHSVERVAMRARQPTCPLRIGYADRQLLEALLCNGQPDVDRCRTVRQLAEPVLRGDLPSAGRADDDGVRLVRERPVRGL